MLRVKRGGTSFAFHFEGGFFTNAPAGINLLDSKDVLKGTRLKVSTKKCV